jgi:hypothetical protein
MAAISKETIHKNNMPVSPATRVIGVLSAVRDVCLAGRGACVIYCIAAPYHMTLGCRNNIRYIRYSNNNNNIIYQRLVGGKLQVKGAHGLVRTTQEQPLLRVHPSHLPLHWRCQNNAHQIVLHYSRTLQMQLGCLVLYVAAAVGVGLHTVLNLYHVIHFTAFQRPNAAQVKSTRGAIFKKVALTKYSYNCVWVTMRLWK